MGVIMLMKDPMRELFQTVEDIMDLYPHLSLIEQIRKVIQWMK